MEAKRNKVPAHLNGQRIDTVYQELFSELSRKQVKKIIDAGGAYRNKKRVSRAGELVQTGDLLEMYWQKDPHPTEQSLEGKTLRKEDLLFEGPDYLVVAKPAGLPSQATIHSTKGTIIEAIQKDLLIQGEVFLVHRLDKETSGLMIFARNHSSRSHFENLFLKKIVSKVYLAIVSGKPAAQSGSINDSIAKDSLGQNRYMIVKQQSRAFGAQKSKSSNHAKSAETGYRVISTAADQSSSLIEFFPKTGRTHQIRVHSAQSLGCPLVGDKTYGSQIIGHPVHRQTPRQMLHAWKIKFPEPGSGAWKEFVAPLPVDFGACLEACKIAVDL